jgi:Fe-S oxidoreductase
MALEDTRADMELCSKCSICKYIPLERLKSAEHTSICPSISKYNFNAYSGHGRVNIGVAMLDGRLEYTDRLLHIIHNCQMCGGCDIACKYAMDMEVLEPIYETRIRSVEDGHTHPALDALMTSLRRQDTMVPGAKSRRADWADGLDVKDFTKQKSSAIFFAGCRASYDKDLWPIARATVSLLRNGGVDIAVGGESESCCGGRAYGMGYKDDFLRQARRNVELFEEHGVKTLIAGCAECYHAFKVLYDKFGVKGDLEVLHATEYLDRLIKEGKLAPKGKIDLKVTYHDPCHLGRLGEAYIRWEGTLRPGHTRRFDPPKEFRRGTYGTYQPPRDVLRSIPGLKLAEMDRIKEYAFCCGSGGGVKDSNPDFALSTAKDRIDEAESTGADVIATACSGCTRNLRDAARESGSNLQVMDIVELLDQVI